ncbi:MAG: DUF3592 domain-containing protein [Microcystaceae cyanobacterium]
MKWIVLVVVGIFVAVGAGLMLSGFHQIKLAHASHRWPTASGQITHSQVQINSDSDGTTYKPIIKFSYRYQGRNLTSDNIFFGGGGVATGDRRYADKFVRKYPVGKRVQVAYNPHRPKQSVLEAGLTKKSFIQFTFGSLFFMMGGGVGILYWLFL